MGQGRMFERLVIPGEGHLRRSLVAFTERYYQTTWHKVRLREPILRAACDGDDEVIEPAHHVAIRGGHCERLGLILGSLMIVLLADTVPHTCERLPSVRLSSACR
jgi:hypothetical protein